MFEFNSITINPTVEIDIDLMNQMMLNDVANERMRKISLEPPLAHASMDNNVGTTTPGTNTTPNALYFAKNVTTGVELNVDNVINSPLSIEVSVDRGGIYRFYVIALVSSAAGDCIPTLQITDIDTNAVQEIGGYITSGTQSSTTGHFYTPSILFTDRWLYGGKTYRFSVTTGLLATQSDDIGYINAYQFPPTIAYFWVQGYNGTGQQIEVPNFQVPLFSVEFPDIDIPNFDLLVPDFPDFDFPDINFPDFDFGDIGNINIDLPNLDIDFDIEGDLDLIEAGSFNGSYPSFDLIAAPGRYMGFGGKSTRAVIGPNSLSVSGVDLFGHGNGPTDISPPQPENVYEDAFNWGAWGWAKPSQLIPITTGKIYAQGTMNFIEPDNNNRHKPNVIFSITLVHTNYEDDDNLLGYSIVYLVGNYGNGGADLDGTYPAGPPSYPGGYHYNYLNIHEANTNIQFGNPVQPGNLFVPGTILRVEFDNTERIITVFNNHTMFSALDLKEFDGSYAPFSQRTPIRAIAFGLGTDGNYQSDFTTATPDHIWGVDDANYSFTNLKYGIV